MQLRAIPEPEARQLLDALRGMAVDVHGRSRYSFSWGGQLQVCNTFSELEAAMISFTKELIQHRLGPVEGAIQLYANSILGACATSHH
jgi:hypothetical protein